MKNEDVPGNLDIKNICRLASIYVTRLAYL